MARVSTLNAGISLYTCARNLDGHRLRWLVAEKGVENLRQIMLEPGERNEDLLVLNARHELPTLVERNLVISGMRIIAEYLDERYPYPSMMPSDPAGRARLRMTIRLLRMDLAEAVENGAKAKVVEAALLSLEALLGRRKFLVGGSITLADIDLVPVLWRLRSLGYVWPKGAPTLYAYAERMSQRPAFLNSLTRRDAAMGLS